MVKRKCATDDTKSSAASSAQPHRLAFLGRSSFATKSAIDKLLRDIDGNGLPDAFSRKSQYRERKEMCRDIMTPYGPLIEELSVPLDDGKPYEIGFQNPQAFLHYACKHSHHFASVVRGAAERYPPSVERPWNLILYQDGVNPSDGLAKNHSRKSVVFYWAFLEYGMAALAQEQVWGTATLTRLVETNKIEGGIPRLTAMVLGRFFGCVHDFSVVGCTVELLGDDKVVNIVAELGCIFADRPALQEMLSDKGHRGILCCPKCRNVTQHTAPHGGVPLWQISDSFVSICETDTGKWKMHTDRSLREHVRRLHARKAVMRPEEFTEAEVQAGFTYNAYAITIQERYNVASALMYDWPHIYACDGIGYDEITSCFAALKRARSQTSYFEFAEYMKPWTFPKGRDSVGHLFTPDAAKKHHPNVHFLFSASEFLTLALVLLHYIEKVDIPRGDCAAECRSLVAVLASVELLLAVKCCDVVTSEVLRRQLVKHIRLYIEAYGENAVEPKHHYALHLPLMLADFGTLLSTLTNERRHRVVRRYTQGRMNLQRWAVSSLEDVTVHQMWELKHPFGQAFTTSYPRKFTWYALQDIFPGVPKERFTLHDHILINGGGARRGDLVSFEALDGSMHIGELLLSVGVQGAHGEVAASELYSFVTRWVHAPKPSDDNALVTYRVVNDPAEQVLTSRLDTVFTYRMSEKGLFASVMIPCECRK